MQEKVTLAIFLTTVLKDYVEGLYKISTLYDLFNYLC